MGNIAKGKAGQARPGITALNWRCAAPVILLCAAIIWFSGSRGGFELTRAYSPAARRRIVTSINVRTSCRPRAAPGLAKRKPTTNQLVQSSESERGNRILTRFKAGLRCKSSRFIEVFLIGITHGLPRPPPPVRRNESVFGLGTGPPRAPAVLPDKQNGTFRPKRREWTSFCFPGISPIAVWHRE